MNILIVSEVYRPGVGGVPVAIDTLSDGLVAAGDSVTVMSGSPHGPWRSYREAENSVEVVRLPAIPSPINPANNRLTVLSGRAIKRYFRDHQPDIIHFHTPWSPFYDHVAYHARRLRIPYVVTNHTIPANFEMNSRFSWALQPLVQAVFSRALRFMNSAQYVTAPTNSALSVTPGLTGPSRAISNGVDVDYYQPGQADPATLRKLGVNPTRRLVTFTGRLDGEKRIDILIDAIEKVARQHNDIQLVIVGRGMLDGRLRQRAIDLGIPHVFTGYIDDDDKRSVLQASSLVVMPSPAELQCIAGLEALACGVPLVVADQLALPELLDNGKNGWLFEYPSPDDCAAMMAQLLDDPRLRGQMSSAARDWVVQRHSAAKVIEQYQAVYHDAATKLA